MPHDVRLDGPVLQQGSLDPAASNAAAVHNNTTVTHQN